MKIGYEESKCVCCNKVFCNSFLMDVRGEEREHYIICPDCAIQVHKFVESILKLIERGDYEIKKFN